MLADPNTHPYQSCPKPIIPMLRRKLIPSSTVPRVAAW